MAPQIPGTSSFSLKSTLGLGLSFPQESELSPLELCGAQSHFAFLGSAVVAQNLH
jgi:hypothetical protein